MKKTKQCISIVRCLLNWRELELGSIGRKKHYILL